MYCRASLQHGKLSSNEFTAECTRQFVPFTVCTQSRTQNGTSVSGSIDHLNNKKTGLKFGASRAKCVGVLQCMDFARQR